MEPKQIFRAAFRLAEWCLGTRLQSGLPNWPIDGNQHRQLSDVNMIGSENVLAVTETLDACKRVVCFSTSEVFGQHAVGSEITGWTHC